MTLLEHEKADAALHPLPPPASGRPIISAADFQRNADRLKATTAQIRAVVLTEVGQAGGFLADGRARTLFEAHLFGRATNHIYDRTNPDISSAAWNKALYKGGAAEYPRIEKAASLAPVAALTSASWGLGQVLGSNHKAAGFEDVFAFVQAMQESEGRQLDAMMSFIAGAGLADELRQINADPVNCRPFARGYNGPGYEVNAYHTKIAANFARLVGAFTPPNITGMLHIGMTGQNVQRLQRALNFVGRLPRLSADGVFGNATQAAIASFQAAEGLTPDGVAGPQTLGRLRTYGADV